MESEADSVTQPDIPVPAPSSPQGGLAPPKKEQYEGTKTFFFSPDLSLMPDDFLSHFFHSGFEVYYILEDQQLDIYSKIRELIALFPEIILFFNIDRKMGNVGWPDFVASIKFAFGERAKIGVVYGKIADYKTRRRLERTYLYDIGIYCGCIPLGYHKAENLARLTDVLTANQANGRRKSLRALCGSSCTVNMVRNGVRHEGQIRDISISHFSCVFEGSDPAMSVEDKAPRIQLKLAGTICTVDAVVRTKRVIEGALLHVFVFTGSSKNEGLRPDVLAKVNSFIHTYFVKNVGDVIQAGFQDAIAKGRTYRRPKLAYARLNTIL